MALARAGAPAWPAVLSLGRAQWRLLCVRAQAGGGGGGARALAETRTREPRLVSDPGVVAGCVAWRCANGDLFGLLVFRLSLRAPPGFLSQRLGGVGVCVRARERGAARGGVAFARGNGGGRLCVGLGGWAALRPTSGRERVPGWLGPGKEDGMASCSSRASFRRPFLSGSVSAGAMACWVPRRRRPRFRSGKFCDAEDFGEEWGEGEGVMGPCVRVFSDSTDDACNLTVSVLSFFNRRLNVTSVTSILCDLVFCGFLKKVSLLTQFFPLVLLAVVSG
ncbi:unnamed protein product [Nyctereutes procyonoides]|uniref:(raccoon dog) hypothetical protein n=1 Tax=Nyctereutes procyonoides TaxID=34880 RepID=A0A811Z5A4_NYCPR|nr:unnamed protein product [Nyctereutes procyonoides]